MKSISGGISGINTSVSLFTREWIEIFMIFPVHCGKCVSLFTREWIEIKEVARRVHYAKSLPLYEGVD